MSTATQTKELVTTKPVVAVNPVAQVGKQISGYLNRGSLHLPADYSYENALKQGWLVLQDVVDKDKRPALMVCDQNSIINALTDMIVQGLNPAKKQAYFLVYGRKLVCQRSYFGDMAIVERLKPGWTVYAEVVYKDDVFEFSTIRGVKRITNHSQTLKSVEGPIVAAYAGLVDENGEDQGCEIMTIEQIKQSWRQSKQYTETGVHAKFPDQMAKRTVIRRRCKFIINAADDELLLGAIKREELAATNAEVEEEMAMSANADVIDVSDQVAALPAVEDPEPLRSEVEARKKAKAAAPELPTEDSSEADPY